MPWRPGDEVAEFTNVVALDETDKSVKCRIPGAGKKGEDAIAFVPKSQLSDESEVYKKGTEGTLVVSQWWATTAGLV